ncbi:hypothetical protein SDC9_136506 [bioreactor metagenome]|uniref:YetF C-terminal domain-containing protein n=1 Tax=bioreactor metagenome TaxID=1076179 RepID=A0A645DJF0_9ZZZZ
MFNIILKTIIIYFTIVFAMRIMGKRQIAQLQPYELVLALLIAEVTAKPMDTPGTPLSYGLVSAITLILLYFLIARISIKSEVFKKIFSSKPNILVNKGVILRKELTRLDYTLSDLIEQIRAKGYYDICDIDYAILETNGELSVFPITAKTAPTISDFNLKPAHTNLAYSIIMDGKLQNENIKMCGVTKESILNSFERVGVREISHVFYASIHDNNKIFIQQKNGTIKHSSLPKTEVKNG